jgi:hypothetical protein
MLFMLTPAGDRRWQQTAESTRPSRPESPSPVGSLRSSASRGCRHRMASLRSCRGGRGRGSIGLAGQSSEGDGSCAARGDSPDAACARGALGAKAGGTQLDAPQDGPQDGLDLHRGDGIAHTSSIALQVAVWRDCTRLRLRPLADREAGPALGHDARHVARLRPGSRSSSPHGSTKPLRIAYRVSSTRS